MVLWLVRKDEGDSDEGGAAVVVVVVSMGDDDRVDKDEESEGPEAEVSFMHNSVVECGSCCLCWLCCCSRSRL